MAVNGLKVYLELLEDIFDGDESKEALETTNTPLRNKIVTWTQDGGLRDDDGIRVYVEGMEKASKLLIGFCFKVVSFLIFIVIFCGPD